MRRLRRCSKNSLTPIAAKKTRKPELPGFDGPDIGVGTIYTAATNRWQRPTRWALGARPSSRHRFIHLETVDLLTPHSSASI